MFNAVFVVWREAFEAILIVGILYAFLARHENFTRSKRYLAGGLAAGLTLSAAIAYGIQHAQTELEGMALDYFDAGLLVAAALLMTQMCLWMKKNARFLKRDLEAGLKSALTHKTLFGVATLACLAVAREAAELVVFFFGMGIEAQASGNYVVLIRSAVLGAALSGFTAWAYFRGLKIFKPKIFFGVTGVILLLTASSFLLSGLRKLIQMEAIPSVREQIWDTSWLLDERSTVGGFVSTATGYESSPSLSIAAAAILYWLFVAIFFFDAPSWFRKKPREITAS